MHVLYYIPTYSCLGLKGREVMLDGTDIVSRGKTLEVIWIDGLQVHVTHCKAGLPQKRCRQKRFSQEV